MPVSDAVGKLGDLGDRPSDKMRTLIRLDWDPYGMFPYLTVTAITAVCFTFWMAWSAIAFQIYATLLLLYVLNTYSFILYIVDLGVICSSKLSLMSPPR